MENRVPERPTRPSLLLRLRDRGDAESWRTFVDVYGPLVHRHACSKGLGHADAEDVTQRVFARVARAIESFEYRPEVGRFRQWLGTIVLNEVSRHRHQEARQVRGDVPVPEAIEAPAQDTAWAAEFNAHVLRVALERCRPRFEEPTWRAFERAWVENRPALDVAQELGRPIDWVYVAKSRVLKQLWREVCELADDFPALAGFDG